MSQVSRLHGWVTFRVWTKESCPTIKRMRHASRMHRWVMSTYKWVMSHLWMSPVPLTNESCPTYEWVKYHVCMDESRSTYEQKSHVPLYYEWVMSHVCIDESCLHTKESCLTYEWDLSHLRMSHVPLTNESCPTYEWVKYRDCMDESCPTYERKSDVPP